MNYDWSMTMMDDPPDHGRALTAARGTGSVGHPFIAVQRKEPGDRLRDKDLAAW